MGIKLELHSFEMSACTIPATPATHLHACGPDMTPGSSTVLVDGLPAARMGDQTAHGGVIVAGCPTVMMGS